MKIRSTHTATGNDRQDDFIIRFFLFYLSIFLVSRENSKRKDEIHFLVTSKQLGETLKPLPTPSPCCSNKICENSFCETFVATEKNNFRSKMFFYLAGHKHNRTRIVSKWAERGDGGGGGCDLHPGNAIFVVCEL